MAKAGTIIIDPGHGGGLEVGGSSPNNAVSPSGVLEKNVALSVAFLTRDSLLQEALAGGHTLTVVLTREKDENVGLRQRAAFAAAHQADLFLSIHCNASETHTARGIETLIRPKKAGNQNHAADKAFAQRIQSAVFSAIQAHDPRTRDRKVKNQLLAVLRDDYLGRSIPACLLEVEFIDVPAVDLLLNIGPTAPRVREEIAQALALALIASL